MQERKRFWNCLKLKQHMQNRDNLEEFIKNEIDSIEFSDADSMWQEFQVQLQKEEPKSNRRRRNLIILFLFCIFFVAGGLLITGAFDKMKIPSFSESEEILTNKDGIALSQNQPKNINEQISKTIEKSDDYGNSKRLKDKINQNLKTEPHKTSVNQESASISSEYRKGKPENRDLNSENEDTDLSIVADKWNFKTSEIVSSLIRENEQVAGVTNFIQSQVGSLGKYQLISDIDEISDLNSLEQSVLFIDRIPLQELREQWLEDFSKNLLLADLQYNPSTFSAKNLFLSIENSYAENGIRQHAVGFGKHFSLSENLVIKVQGGGSLDVGCSLSQDSLFVFNGVSIVEIRRDKDLKNLWNAYLDFGLYQVKNKWRFGTGLRSSYALVNQFYLTEHTRTTHLGTFNALNGTTNYEKVERGSWAGINRMNFEAYLNINYHLNSNYSMGIFAIKRLNKVIDKDMAKQAYSNTPVRVGVSLSKHF